MNPNLPENKKRQGERNPGASLQQKLRNHAKAAGDDVALVLVRYLNERFLYRLSRSPYREHFVLRGAILFTGIGRGFPIRTFLRTGEWMELKTGFAALKADVVAA